MHLLILFSILTSFLLSLLFIPVLRKMAISIGLVDKPNKRKVHNAATPLVGGLGIFLAVTLSIGLTVSLFPAIFLYKNIVFTIFILLIMGVIDDRFDLRASLKLVIQLLCAHFIYSQGIRIESFHGLFNQYGMNEQLQYIMTIVTITGVINAFNLMDGIDGLAAGMAVIAFTVFSVLAYVSGQLNLVLIFTSFLGALVAFLKYNLSKHQKVFMGDQGSITIGFVLVVSGIHLLQRPNANFNGSLIAVAVMAILMVPVFDALRVFRRRLKSGKSPFHADKTHLHHLMLMGGLKPEKASIAILSFVIIFLVTGFLCFEMAGITFAIISLLFIFYVATSFLQFHNGLIKWKNQIKNLEINMKY